MLLTFTHHEFMEMLERRARAAGSRRKLARQIGVGYTHLDRVMRDVSEPSNKLLSALGLRKVTMFQTKG